ncbi:MAG: hypothetical protein AB7F82_00390 [Alphaproteobacteria bacterium]
MENSALRILKEYSEGKHCWRRVVRNLKLWDFDELKTLMAQHNLPMPTLHAASDQKNIDALMKRIAGEGP